MSFPAEEKHQTTLSATKATLTKTLNTVLVGRLAHNIPSSLSEELLSLFQGAEFEALLVAVKHLALKEGISLKEASERLINTLSSLEKLWGAYVIQQGLRAIKGHHSNKVQTLKS